MAGPRTLAVAESLSAAGFEVWTPRATFKRHRPRSNAVVDVEAPILPTFVFAQASQLSALAHAAAEAVSPHPPFTIFRYAGRIPLIGAAEVAGLKAEEERAEAARVAQREAETREEAERIRIEAIKSETARRRLLKQLEREREAGLRASCHKFEAGAAVTVDRMPALQGVTGVVVSQTGHTAWVRFGTMAWKVEAWRLNPIDVQDCEAP